MKPRSRIVAISAAGIVVATSLLAFAQTRAPGAVKTGYAPVNGLNLYYEIHGTGEPLILLHGGLGSTGMFDAILPSLAENRQVIAVDLQAHGRTANIDRPLSYEAMADDVAALIHYLKFERADVLGFSLAGCGKSRLEAFVEGFLVDKRLWESLYIREGGAAGRRRRSRTATNARLE